MPNESQAVRSNERQIDNYVFRAIADYTDDWESWHSPEGRLLWVNAAVERMTVARLREQDPAGEVVDWLRAIRELLTT